MSATASSNPTDSSAPDARRSADRQLGANELTRKSVSIGHEGRWDFGKTKVNLYHNDFDNEVVGPVQIQR